MTQTQTQTQTQTPRERYDAMHAAIADAFGPDVVVRRPNVDAAMHQIGRILAAGNGGPGYGHAMRQIRQVVEVLADATEVATLDAFT